VRLDRSDITEIVIDLRRPPADRWRLTARQLDQARELFRVYQSDLGLGAGTGEFLVSAARHLIREDYWAEMESLAASAGLATHEVVLCNLYYDALKAVLGRPIGCTAFALDTDAGVLHARNLDWWTEESALARSTAVCRFTGAPAGEFVTVGWPGFCGAFSGVAAGRFAITLNAVSSDEPTQFAMPVVMLIRSVLENARNFEEAKSILCGSSIPCDCLLLLTGTRWGEMVVIERTPSRHATRSGVDGFVCVTNGYQALEVSSNCSPSPLLSTWCRRFERASELIQARPPRIAEECFEYLSDSEVRMNITVQQMVFCAATGEHWVRAAAE
jgi:acid ceramidase